MITSAVWEKFCIVTLLYRTRSAAWNHPVGSHHHRSHDQGWSTACGGWRPLQHCHTCAPREYASLVVRLCQQRLPLHLRLVALREPWDTWLYWSPPRRGDRVGSHGTAPDPSSAGRRVQSCGTRGSTGALLGREVRFRAVGHVVA
jgi:hypothetical protein